ncbi:MAG: DNA adenine methylase [Ahrensia sp.]
MSVTASPLRYPGGKSCLLHLVASILRKNNIRFGAYAEPYAGGCGLALDLLFKSYVSEIHINDIDPSIWAFWSSILDDTESLIDLINSTPVTLDQWHRQKEVQRQPQEASKLELGFAAFFLNRTNRSGIIKGAGVIGGLNQTGNYKIDCRFNKEGLIKRIRRIAKYRSQITLHNLDAISFMSPSTGVVPDDAFLCIDPPYFKKGSSLYTSFYGPDDHAGVAAAVLKLSQPWIVTYDNAPEVRELYKSRRQFNFDINYSVQTKRLGTELLIASKGLRIPEAVRERQTHKPQYRAA